jgi:sigma-B regulation protein RsbU (phosphoserine phosphatase)
MNDAAVLAGDWRARLDRVVELMKDMSRHTDPQEMVRAYAARIGGLLPIDRRISLSRRGLEYPKFRITRSTTWTTDINPWLEKDRLPLFEGGLLAELLYANEPRVIDELEVAEDEPAAEYLRGPRSLCAIPMFDRGEALNMVVVMRAAPAAFSMDDLPQMVWMSNLFGRATGNLVLSDELARANQSLDREMHAVGAVQRSLLPARLPTIPTLDLAVYYQPSQRAGGDYYDFFPLPEGRWGIFIADVSGHGSPAAVLMAVTHCIAHTNPGQTQPPAKVLDYLNRQLARLYTSQLDSFVTAFYGVYDPRRRTLTYSCAGHNPPRLKRCSDGSLVELDEACGVPLGLVDDEEYEEHVQQLQPGDQIVFYTDGIVDAADAEGRMFGTERLDRVLENCSLHAASLLDTVLASMNAFSEGHPPHDDQTMIVARVT